MEELENTGGVIEASGMAADKVMKNENPIARTAGSVGDIVFGFGLGGRPNKTLEIAASITVIEYTGIDIYNLSTGQGIAPIRNGIETLSAAREIINPTSASGTNTSATNNQSRSSVDNNTAKPQSNGKASSMTPVNNNNAVKKVDFINPSF